MPSTVNIIHFTYHDAAEFTRMLKRREIDTVFRSLHNKRIRYRGIDEYCQRMLSFEEEMPGLTSSSYSGYGCPSWSVKSNGWASWSTQDRKSLNDELTRLKVNHDQRIAFRGEAKTALTKRVTVSSLSESTDEGDTTEKSVKTVSQKYIKSFDRENNKPVGLVVTLTDKSYGSSPELKFELRIPPMDESQIAEVEEGFSDNNIKLVHGFINIERL